MKERIHKQMLTIIERIRHHFEFVHQLTFLTDSKHERTNKRPD